MNQEVKSKSKVRRFASNFTDELIKSFGNLRKACRSKRNQIVFCSVPFFCTDKLSENKSFKF